MQNLIFGTDGIRGIANTQVSANLVFFVGRALAVKILQNGKSIKKVIVGKDTRVSGDMLFCALSAGLLSMGIDIINVGLCTTPALSYLTKYTNSDYGMIITASHNPANHNGIKIFNSFGLKVMPKFEEEIRQILSDIDSYLPTEKVGKIYNKTELIRCYTQHILDNIKYVNASNYKIAIDCANGAGSKIIPYVYKKLLRNCTCFNCSTNGQDINKECGSINTKKFCSIVKQRFDVGFSFDGDADRVVVVQKDGSVLSGEMLLYIISKYYKQNNLLKKDCIVTTILTNMGIINALKDIGIDAYCVDVGDKHIMQKMLNEGVNIGAEESGHIILKDIVPSADGMLAGLVLLKIFCELKFDIQNYINELKVYNNIKENVIVTEKQKAIFNTGVLRQYVKTLEKEMQDGGRIIVRSSGTECAIRILIEGKNQKLMQDIASKLKEKILSI